MKNLIICMFALTLLVSSCHEDEDYENFLPYEIVDQFGTSDGEAGIALSFDTQGNLYLGGETWYALPGNEHKGANDAFVVKYGADGQRQWIRQFGTYHMDIVSGLGTDASGNSYLAAYTFGDFEFRENDITDVESFLAKHNSNGDLQWISRLECLDVSNDSYAMMNYAYSLVVDADGNSYLTGETRCHLQPELERRVVSDLFLTKYDSNGQRQWLVQFEGGDGGRDLTLDEDGNIYLVSEGLAGVSSVLPTIIKCNSNGQMLWAKSIDNLISLDGKAIVLDAWKNIYVVGNIHSDIFLAKHDSEGNQLWFRRFERPEGMDLIESKDLVVDDQGSVYIAGYVSEYYYDDRDNWVSLPDTAVLLKYDTDGEYQRMQRFTTGESSKAIGAAIAPDGKFYLTGRTDGSFPGFQNQGHNDVFLLRYPGETWY